MDIQSDKKYPSNALSNFAPHPFILDDVQINSMEGWLQSLKYNNFEMQKEICKLVGRSAKYKGSSKNWKRLGKLYWNNKEYDRFSKEYQYLLNRAYQAIYDQNTKFKKALMSTIGMTLTHNIGRKKPADTILTSSEFCKRLTLLRDYGRLI